MIRLQDAPNTSLYLASLRQLAMSVVFKGRKPTQEEKDERANKRFYEGLRKAVNNNNPHPTYAIPALLHTAVLLAATFRRNNLSMLEHKDILHAYIDQYWESITENAKVQETHNQIVEWSDERKKA